MSVAKRVRRGWMIAPALACMVLVGCKDDDDEGNPSSPDAGDSGVSMRDGGMDASTNIDGGPSRDGGADASTVAPFQGAVSKLAALSSEPAELDRLAAAAFGADGKIYAAGYVRKVAGGVTDQQMAVARFTTDGNLDPTWGAAGVVLVNANVATANAPDTLEAARGIGFQSDGKIVIVGNVPRGKTAGTPELDQVDIAVARLTAAGALDATGPDAYSAADADGVAGVAIVDLGPPAQRTNNNTTSTINDDAYGLAIDGLNRTVVFARGKGEEASRTDWDRYVLRLTPAGALDSTFAGDGKYSYDVAGTNMLDDNARNGVVVTGNKIVSAGYTNIGGKNTISLLRLNENGSEDTGFGTAGKVTINPLAPNGMAEAYGMAVQSNGSYVTIGYGNEGQPPNKVVSFRFSAAGVKDPGYGLQGNLLFDLQADADQGRNIVALSDDRLLAVGNSNSAMGVSDGLVALFSKDGQPLNAEAVDFGRGSEQLLGVALSRDGTWAAGVGYSSGGTSGPDDGAIWIYRLKP